MLQGLVELEGRKWRNVNCILAKLSCYLHQWKVLCDDGQAILLQRCILLLDKRRGELLLQPPFIQKNKCVVCCFADRRAGALLLGTPSSPYFADALSESHLLTSRKKEADFEIHQSISSICIQLPF